MPLKNFICPDGVEIPYQECLKEGGCRRHERCATRSYLRLVSKERPWTGRPSTTQLIQGTMQAFLKITKDYSISPDQRAFMVHGTKGHANLEASDDELSLLEEKFDDADTEITGIADVYEEESGNRILADYKTSGSYKVAKALGFTTEEEETGEVYKSGKRKGEKKTRKILVRRDDDIDRWEWELQLNKYRIEFEKRGYPVDEMRIQCCVRDGGTFIARSRGVFRNVYYFKIAKMPDEEVLTYFDTKKKCLEQALKQGKWSGWCSKKESWDGLKCAKYCEVAEFCPLGKMYKQEREVEDMAIKGVSDIRRLPRVGKIRLGIKKKKGNVEYPMEVDYFVIDPQTPSAEENELIKTEISNLYGANPKQIKVMFPLPDLDIVFPQWWKRYGSGALRCKGDGDTAVVTQAEFATGLEIIGKTEEGLKKVKCLGKECPYVKEKKCAMRGTLQCLLPEVRGSGVWQINTGSFNSIINLNSCLEYVKSVCGRFHMIPLVLERREQTITHDGKARKHYVLHLNMDVPLKDLQQYALIKPEQIMLELPEIEIDKEDIYYQENTEVNALPAPEKKDELEEQKDLEEQKPRSSSADKERDKDFNKSIETATKFSDEMKEAKTLGELKTIAQAIKQTKGLFSEHKDWLRDEFYSNSKQIKTSTKTSQT